MASFSINGAEVADDLEKLKKKIKSDAEEFVQEVSVDLHREITLNTPVETGEARGSNNLSVNFVDRTRSIDKSGFRTILRANLAAKFWRLGDSLTISNATPQFTYVDQGTRHISPRHIVQRALDTIRRKYR